MRRRSRIAAALLGASLAVGIAAGLMPSGSAPRPPFVAYRGPHRIGDLIGANARVVAVDAHGNPTAVVSTDGRPPVVWAFEMADASSVRAIRGVRVRALDRRLWAHPACPSSLCSAGSPGAPIALPPPPLAIDPCPAIPVADLAARLGPRPITATSPGPGTCVWDNGVAGVQLEIGGSGWWAYLHRTYAPLGAALVDTRYGLHLAVHRGPVTAVLLTDADPSPGRWQPLAEEAAAWAASH